VSVRRVKMVCRNCGSADHVLKDAYAFWNEEEQMWELNSVYDNAVCESDACDGGETKILEVPL
jgi:hypothetical protein